MRKDTPDYVKVLAKEIRKNQTKAESKLWQRLRANRLLGYKFKRQYCLGRYIADFYCSEARLIIEVDGSIHKQAEQSEYDITRDKDLTARDVRVLRFSNDQVMNKMNEVISTIIKMLKQTENHEKTLYSTQTPFS